jgi:peroxiredoxin Q/BCP
MDAAARGKAADWPGHPIGNQTKRKEKFAMAHAVATPIQTHLGVGDQVPYFSLPYATREKQDMVTRISSDDLAGRRYLIVFHPADWSDTCTRQAQGLRDDLKEFEKFKLEILLVSGDYIFSRHEWARHLKLPFNMLSDHKHGMGKAFGIYDEASGFDTRSVFLVDANGRLEYINSRYDATTDKDYLELKAAVMNTKKM